jgi:flavin reductase (DIM6/NTAB) family NADH-FMN oxidoreductase RutF
MKNGDSRELRDVLGRFATGVAVVTTLSSEHQPIGITINSFASVSLEPPLVLFSIDRRARSFGAFRAARWFAINVLGEAQARLSARFAQASIEKWAGVRFDVGQGGCPILRSALAVLECEAQRAYEAGDHVIFLSRIDRTCVDPGGRPLLFYRGEYATLAARAAAGDVLELTNR